MAESGSLIELMRREMPIRLAPYDLPASDVGLIIVDVVNGFCTVGAGNLAPVEPNAQIARMVDETARLARRFSAAKRPILAFLDTHEPGKPEPPYPPHCERGTGEENLVPELEFLKNEPDAVLIRKDCINDFVGSIEATPARNAHGVSHNRCVDWINQNRLKAVVAVGICTEICVADFVGTLLSARNHGLVPTLKDVVVLEPACATYDLPMATVRRLGLPETAAHPQAPAHHLGLYTMAARGALLAQELKGA
jgi:nicotinamidase-related amidase